MRKPFIFVGIVFLISANAGAAPWPGFTRVQSIAAAANRPVPQEQTGDFPTVIARAPTDSATLPMSSMEFHGALLRGNKEQLAVLIADDFKGDAG